MKQVIFGNEVRVKLLEGINLVSKAVASTIGPLGRNVILSRDTAPPIVTNDGVSIASYFNKVEDPWVNTGVQMIKEVSVKQNEPGDGTTTATILASALVNEGMKHLLAGIDPITIREGINRASVATIQKLRDTSMPIENKETLVKVATISVEDEATGRMIGEMMYEVGKDGAITVETSKEVKLEKDMAQGIKFDQGYITPYLMTNPFRQEAVYEDVPILVTNHTITVNEELVPIVDQLSAKGIKAMVIICRDMKNEALNTVVYNTVNGIFSFLVIRLPGFDDLQTSNGEDIAVAVGAKFIHRDLDSLDQIQASDLGSAEKVITKLDSTVIVRGGGTKKQIDDRVKVLKEERKVVVSDFDRDQIKERIARLTGGIGVIRIGAATEQELVYKKHKIEDALAATRAAAEEGIVAGGGVALLRLSQDIEKLDDVGELIFHTAIRQPIVKIAENAGRNPETVIEKVLENSSPNWGWDAKKNEYKDLIESGIIDPVKVTRKAVENAVSMAVMMLSAESLVVDVPEEDKMSMRDKVRTGQAGK